jgi:monoamine oxidase
MRALLHELDLQTFDTFTTEESTFVYEGKIARLEAPLLPLPAADLAEVAATIVQLDVMAAEVQLEAPWMASQAAWDAETAATWLDDNITTAGARAALDIMMGGALSVAPRELSLLHYLFLVKSTGGAERFISTKGGVLESRVIGGRRAGRPGAAQRTRAADRPDGSIGPAHYRPRHRLRPACDCRRPADHRRAHRLRSAAAHDPGTPQAAVPDGVGIQGRCLVPNPILARGWAQWLRQRYRCGPRRHGVFDSSPPEGSPGVLHGLIEGDAARSWGPRPMVECKAAVLAAFARFFGPKAKMPTDYVEHDRAAEPWIRGGRQPPCSDRPNSLGRHGVGDRAVGQHGWVISAAKQAVADIIG